MSESAATAVELLEHALTLLDREIPACLGAADFTADKMPVLGSDEPGPTLLTLLGQVRMHRLELVAYSLTQSRFESRGAGGGGFPLAPGRP